MVQLRSNTNNGSWRGVPRPGSGELVLSELFGPTLQGEGPSAGQSAYFVRLGVCNLACEWCDTAYTWDSSKFDLAATLKVVSTSAVVASVLRSATKLAVITGGEPALQSTELVKLAESLHENAIRVELETNGTVTLGPLVDYLDLVVASPKLHNSGHKHHQRIRRAVLQDLSLRHNVVFKFVVRSVGDLHEVDKIVRELGIGEQRVWIMPEARTPVELIAGLTDIAQAVADRGWSVSNRLHILVWGDERGR